MMIFDNVFPLGIGTNRFPVKNANDQEGIERSAELLISALEAGLSYIDVGYNYSAGAAESICKLAFANTKARRNVTVKSTFTTDKTADDALRRIYSSFSNMGIDHASYFIIWNISSYNQFEEIMQKDALYDGAVKAKAQGLIDHICFSTHAPPGDIIKIIESGAFESATIAFSALNNSVMLPVLECSNRNNVGIVAMNPLGGGVIPQNSEYFSFLKHEDENSTTNAALRYINAHPAVKIILSGINNRDELNENIKAFNDKNPESDTARIERVNASFRELKGFCTGCRYCEKCPSGIKISTFMQSHNAALFKAAALYGRTESELTKDIQIFRKIFLDFQYLPENADNPCKNCGVCESECTQGLKIATTLKTIYQSIHKRCFSRIGRKERLAGLLKGKGYKLVGFYPGGGYSQEILNLYKMFFGEPDFNIVFFDGNPKLWGNKNGSVTIHSPDDISFLRPDLILVSNYIYQDDIYNSIKHFEPEGILIKKLHQADDVPWVF